MVGYNLKVAATVTNDCHRVGQKNKNKVTWNISTKNTWSRTR